MKNEWLGMNENDNILMMRKNKMEWWWTWMYVVDEWLKWISMMNEQNIY